MVKHLGIYQTSTISEILSDEFKSEVLEFHDKTKYESSVFENAQEKAIKLNSDTFLSKVERTSLDITCGLDKPSIYLGRKKKIKCRESSIRQFSDEKVSFDVLKDIIFSTLISDEKNSREYTSAGGIYSIETFVSIDLSRIKNTESKIKEGVYFVDNNASKLVLINEVDGTSQNDFLGIKGYNFSNVCFSIISVLNLYKNLFKYGYRGYRHALIEVGNVNCMLKSSAASNGLSSCESADFDDNYLAYMLKVNEEQFKPILIQHFGYKSDA